MITEEHRQEADDSKATERAGMSKDKDFSEYVSEAGDLLDYRLGGRSAKWDGEVVRKVSVDIIANLMRKLDDEADVKESTVDERGEVLRLDGRISTEADRCSASWAHLDRRLTELENRISELEATVTEQDARIVRVANSASLLGKRVSSLEGEEQAPADKPKTKRKPVQTDLKRDDIVCRGYDILRPAGTGKVVEVDCQLGVDRPIYLVEWSDGKRSAHSRKELRLVRKPVRKGEDKAARRLDVDDFVYVIYSDTRSGYGFGTVVDADWALGQYTVEFSHGGRKTYLGSELRLVRKASRKGEDQS